MHDEFAPRKEETIRLGFIGVIDHLPLLLSSQLGELVDVLPSVCASGDASRESELKLRQDLIPEKVFLYQHQIFQWFLSDYFEL